MARPDIHARLQPFFSAGLHRRFLAGEAVVLHGHHHHAHLQSTIEGAARINGKKILRAAAEAAFLPFIKKLFRPADTRPDQVFIAQSLYAYLGYGKVRFSAAQPDQIVAESSHFVEGWNTSFGGRTAPVCTFTEGYLQGALRAMGEESATVREQSCMVAGHDVCTFQVSYERDDPPALYPSSPANCLDEPIPGTLVSPHIDAQQISHEIAALPLYGRDEDGLLPAFGGYLAHIPAEFYNSIHQQFLEQMADQGLLETARKLLAFAAETSAIHTFRGVISSAEWQEILAPRLRAPADTLFALLAVTHSFGWGHWQVTAHEPGQLLILESRDSSEAIGHRAARGTTRTPQCHMLTGVAAGIMEFVYGNGSIKERFGTFSSEEKKCICCGHKTCSFHVMKL